MIYYDSLNKTDLTFTILFYIIVLPVEKNRLYAVWFSGYDLEQSYIPGFSFTSDQRLDS